MRYFVEFSYFGKRYHGWQNQPNALTVQQVLEETFSTFFRRPIALVGAGRTDAGVHAKQMFAHFDCDEIENIENVVYRLNAFLPEDIALCSLFKVPEEAHARFDALERTYEYWVVRKKNPFYSDFAHLVKRPLNIAAMNEAASVLMQYEDFECFSKSNTDVKTYLCNIRRAFWEVREDRWVFTISADRFLRNMVRAVVGTLLEVGTGKTDVGHVKSVINSRDRRMAGPSVPAKGLYLTSVLYPEKITGKDG
ncbi:tRNA pseudouridine(38-40) synthase TruA [Pseudozobellia thermophila]|uniref:tRNA pseudouridine synthase A n=1 Tax=Pseudozobellia thermophila TaxID=192903 RepID=A0A1M6HJ50_9FLAO|nr:tRNA pseudouridine(38-40) synthase TruA [Pseudozobellia thermophila]SHJ22184.1 tRNA pseudouridine38-40 synthase [Pseudozobellia thermophila]